MQNGPDLAKRFYKELTDIQVRWGRPLAAAGRNCTHSRVFPSMFGPLVFNVKVLKACLC